MGVREIIIRKRHLKEVKQRIFCILLCALFFNVINLSTFSVRAQEDINDILYEVKEEIEILPMATELTYGQSLGESTLEGGVVKYGDNIVEGSFNWKYPDIRPKVEDSNSIEYDVMFIPFDETNYNTVDCKIKVTINKARNPENMPSESMNVPSNIKKVKDIKLPERWQWQESDKNKNLKFEQPLVAKAIYNGEDKDNFEIVELSINIIRDKCKHEQTELRNFKKDKYTGDLYCIICGEKLSSGKYITSNNSINQSVSKPSINNQVQNNQVQSDYKENLSQDSDDDGNDDAIDLENTNQIEDTNETLEEENDKSTKSDFVTISMALALGMGMIFFFKGKM